MKYKISSQEVGELNYLRTNSRLGFGFYAVYKVVNQDDPLGISF